MEKGKKREKEEIEKGRKEKREEERRGNRVSESSGGSKPCGFDVSMGGHRRITMELFDNVCPVENFRYEGGISDERR